MKAALNRLGNGMRFFFNPKRLSFTPARRRRLLFDLLVLFFLIYIALFAATSALMFLHEMDLSPSSVVAYYLGNEEELRPPKSFEALLEVSHAHLFAQGILLLTLVHLMLLARIPFWLKVALGTIAYLSAVLNESASWLIRFVHPAFAYLKIATFLTLELSLLLLVATIGLTLLRR